MTPKEKAQELVLKFYDELKHGDCYVRDADCSVEFEHTRMVAEQLALIAAEEVINQLNISSLTNTLDKRFDALHGYWAAVRDEIQKL